MEDTWFSLVSYINAERLKDTCSIVIGCMTKGLKSMHVLIVDYNINHHVCMCWKIEMAKNQDCLQTNVSELRETDSLLPHDQQVTTFVPSCHCRPVYRTRRVRSKGAVLVIMWIILACSNVASYRRLILKLYMEWLLLCSFCSLAD